MRPMIPAPFFIIVERRRVILERATVRVEAATREEAFRKASAAAQELQPESFTAFRDYVEAVSPHSIVQPVA